MRNDRCELIVVDELQSRIERIGRGRGKGKSGNQHRDCDQVVMIFDTFHDGSLSADVAIRGPLQIYKRTGGLWSKGLFTCVRYWDGCVQIRTASYPEHARTGMRGYLGKLGSAFESRQR